MDGSEDFIKREVFQALPEGKRSQKLKQHRTLHELIKKKLNYFGHS
jgi:hypothetical protein